MPENRQPDAPPSVASMVAGLMDDAQKLVRQEVALARCEIAETADKAKTGARCSAARSPSVPWPEFCSASWW